MCCIWLLLLFLLLRILAALVTAAMHGLNQFSVFMMLQDAEIHSENSLFGTEQLDHLLRKAKH